jgi:hypothetical protein
MPDAFELTKIKKLVKEKHIPALIIADTNTVIKEPNFMNWKTSIGEPLFILADVVILELEHLKKKPESREGALKAVESLNALVRRGEILEGIQVEGVGWFISVPTPSGDDLKTELNKLDSVVKAFGPSDTQLLLLAKELNQHISNSVTLLATGDRNLFNIVQLNGIPSYLLTRFPLTGIEDVVKRKSLKPSLQPIDWDSVLEDIRKTTQDRSIKVQLTLTAKRSLPNLLVGPNEPENPKALLIAEGYGIMEGERLGKTVFLWNLPFKQVAWELETEAAPCQSKSEPSKQARPEFKTAHVDFLETEQQIPLELVEALANKIAECASPVAYIEDMPTLQDPASVLETLLVFDYLIKQQDSDKGITDDVIDRLREEINESEGLINFWGDWILASQDTEDDTHIILGELLNAMKSCWAIGRTIDFNLVIGV